MTAILILGAMFVPALLGFGFAMFGIATEAVSNLTK